MAETKHSHKVGDKHLTLPIAALPDTNAVSFFCEKCGKRVVLTVEPEEAA